ncbi:hypothetical protein MKZ38_009662 [Zalerion maritima]|uniref:Trichothecene 3-O-acetyltransferase-like N-terminal domain-containing protein n=1 Tax=Zalerion maritima TaxID=339359 RepID=A0AAD5WSV5_9PEZI|nr:hypothetical protein MKZ38_009662 [Zalerion maritima]
MVLHSLPAKENTQAYNQAEGEARRQQDKSATSHGARVRNALSVVVDSSLQESIIPAHVSTESCVTLTPGLIGSQLHHPASCIPIGYQEKHLQQPPKRDPHTTGIPAEYPERSSPNMGGGNGDSHPLQKTTRTILSICGQTNIRVFNKYMLCFGLPDQPDIRPKVDAHLRESLNRLSRGRPEFAGQLELPATVQDAKNNVKMGYVCLKQSPSFEIPFESHDLTTTFGWTFPQLRHEGFPAKAFVHPRFEIPFDISDKGDLQTCEVRTLHIDGGFILAVWLHHALADGTGVVDFLDSFAGATRGDDVGASQSLELNLDSYAKDLQQISEGKTFEDLVKTCPEYGIHPKPDNPTGAIVRPGGVAVPEIEKAGRIFVFTRQKLEELKNEVNQYLRPGSSDSASSTNTADSQRGGASCYTCLAALTWAHVAKARCTTDTFSPDTEWVGKEDETTARLMNPVNWKPRALKDATKDYYGNATALAITETPLSLLIDACENVESLSKVVGEIRSSINSINDEFICRRLATYYAAPDPRYLGLDIDPRTPYDLGFNTWRELGGDTKWTLPGSKTATKPAAIRRAQGAWNMGGSVIMPASKESDLYELLVTLPSVSMDLLLKDHGYTSKCLRVVE